MLVCSQRYHQTALLHKETILLMTVSGDVAEDKLQLARECGAAQAFNSKDKADDAFQTASTIVVSGAGPAYDLAFKLTKRRGKVIAIGVPNAPISIDCKTSCSSCYETRRANMIL